MNLHEIFGKPVDRDIEGVIKADDVAQLKLEAEEYVLTNEILKRLETFLGAYNDYRGANGVWISGFFGSGKSHLLKMLAFLLENHTFDDGTFMLELFLPKFGDNTIRKANLKKAVDIPSESILFNIDQKAVAASKSDFDAVLSVFVKVFNEKCGYYGRQAYVAQFERDLDERGLYADFKETYQTITGQTWEFGREQIILEEGNVAQAYAQVSDSSLESTQGLVDNYRQDYQLSIGDFANMVNDYVEKQEPNFRLNFFVDEVGQYIADNVKLMTNLQTISESLATKCRGQAWIVVTAQDDMSKVRDLDEKNKAQDFSKIQDRFKTRMKLTSANVDEVIQKRLLKKNQKGQRYLAQLYEKEKNNLGTLFKFSGDSIKYRNFRDENEFLESYPFIPYQFSLFQSAIESLSEYKAFEGQHSSVGERSMLGVFQKVVIEIQDEDVGRLATFDRMYEGIRTVLKSQIQTSIRKAEKNLEEPFTVQVLKTLFLVKYVKEFKATLRNLRVLLYGHFGVDIPALEEKIEKSLLTLERQTYIQRNGKEYEFLTNEEQDVEKEIKNTTIDLSEVVDEIGKIVFSEIIKERKIRDTETKRDFGFTKRWDDRLISREKELAIHLITPFYINADNMSVLQGNNMGRAELMVVLPDDARLRNDLKIYKKTKKYIRQNGKASQRKTISRILAEKGSQNTRRYDDIRRKVKDLTGQARLIVSGDEIQVTSRDPLTRIHKGFESLIKTIYQNLKMLRGYRYSENEIGRFLESTQSGLFDGDDLAPNEAEQEITAFIKQRDKSGGRVTLKRLVEEFTQRPYGWHLNDVQCLLAIALGRGTVTARSDSNLLEGTQLERALKNTRQFSNLVLAPQVAFTAREKRELKDFNNFFFDHPVDGATPKALGQNTKKAFQDVAEDLQNLVHESAPFAFSSALQAPLTTVQNLSKKPYDFFLKELYNQKDELLTFKEEIIDPIKQFMNGPNKNTYQEALLLLEKQEPNFVYLVDSAIPERLRAILDDPACYRGNRMKQAKQLFEELRQASDDFLMRERQSAIKTITEKQEKFHAREEYVELDPEQQDTLDQRFTRLLNMIEGQTMVASIRQSVKDFVRSEYNHILTLMAQWAEPDDEAADHAGVKEKRPVQYIAQEDLRVEFAKDYIENPDDVEAYLDHLKAVMLKAVQDGNRIQI